MSSATMNQFFQDLSEDATMQQQFQEATDRESLVNKVVELGKEKGYSFTPSEAEEWLESAAAYMQSQSDANGELNEEELEAVAGGFSPLVPIATMIGGGITSKIGEKIFNFFTGK